MPFGSFKIGDLSKGVTGLLGEPEPDSDSKAKTVKLDYIEGLGSLEWLHFSVKEEKIITMEFSYWFD